MHSIAISPGIYSRLDSLARGFNATPAKVIEQLLDFHHARQHCSCGATTVVPVPLNEGKQTPVSEPDASRPHSKRDNSRYNFENYRYGKGRLVQAVVAAHVRRNPAITYPQLREVFPQELQGNYGVVRKREEVLANPRWKDPRRRFFVDNPIELADGTTVVVCSQWGNSGTIRNFPKFLDAAENLGYQITKLGDDTDA